MDDSDQDAIRAIIARQFASLSWTRGARPDLEAFLDDFMAGAVLVASARPARAMPADTFASRMDALSRSSLRAFQEKVLGSQIRVFGNVAVAVVACENTENDAATNRNVEMILLVKEAGRWRIAAQAWDTEAEDRPVPPSLLGGGAA